VDALSKKLHIEKLPPRLAPQYSNLLTLIRRLTAIAKFFDGCNARELDECAEIAGTYDTLVSKLAVINEQFTSFNNTSIRVSSIERNLVTANNRLATLQTLVHEFDPNFVLEGFREKREKDTDKKEEEEKEYLQKSLDRLRKHINKQPLKKPKKSKALKASLERFKKYEENEKKEKTKKAKKSA